MELIFAEAIVKVLEAQNTSGFIFLFSFPVSKSNAHDKR